MCDDIAQTLRGVLAWAANMFGWYLMDATYIVHGVVSNTARWMFWCILDTNICTCRRTCESSDCKQLCVHSSCGGDSCTATKVSADISDICLHRLALFASIPCLDAGYYFEGLAMPMTMSIYIYFLFFLLYMSSCVDNWCSLSSLFFNCDGIRLLACA